MRLFSAVFLVAAATPVLAGTSSTFTELDLKNPKVCTDLTPPPVEGEPNDGVEFVCKGAAGVELSFAEGDLRSYVAFGKNAKDHCARFQTFGGFNSAGKTIEWRMQDGKPIATIFRWTVSYDPEDSAKTKEWLVVTKLEAGQSCHMAYVEGAYPKANEVAQRLVDSLAGSFTCKGSRPIFVAKVGTETDSIAANQGCQQ